MKYKKLSKLLQNISQHAMIEVEAEKLKGIKTFDELVEYLRDNEYLNVEIIFFDDAMEFLAKHDPSLMDSLELADEFGYSADDINSSILASLLASKMLEDDLLEAKDEIEKILNKN